MNSDEKVYALMLDGKLLTPEVLREYKLKTSKFKYLCWTPPKKIYFTPGAAKNGRRHVPEEIRDDVKIAIFTFSEFFD